MPNAYKKGTSALDSKESLLHNWPCTDGAGLTVIDIIGGVDGTLNNGATWATEGGVLCNTTGSCITLGSSADLSLNVSDARSIFFLYTYKPGTVTTSTRYFFSASDAGYTVFSFFDSFTSGKTIAYMDGGAWTTASNNGIAPWVVENVQYQVCFQWDSVAEKIEVWYGIGNLDNLLVWESVGTVSPLLSQYHLDIGGRDDPGSNRYCEGIISDVMIIDGWLK